MIILPMVQGVHGIKAKSKLDEIVESSLRSAALWDEVKDRLKNLPWVCPADSSSVCVLHVHWL